MAEDEIYLAQADIDGEAAALRDALHDIRGAAHCAPLPTTPPKRGKRPATYFTEAGSADIIFTGRTFTIAANRLIPALVEVAQPSFTAWQMSLRRHSTLQRP